MTRNTYDSDPESLDAVATTPRKERRPYIVGVLRPRPGGRARRWPSRLYWMLVRHSRPLLRWTQVRSDVLRLFNTDSASTVRPARILAILLAMALLIGGPAQRGQSAAAPAELAGQWIGGGGACAGWEAHAVA
jgi:hypothetical protein